VKGRALCSALAATAALLAAVVPASAKPRDGIPTWVGARAQQAVDRLFGRGHSVSADFNIPERRRVVVVYEFQNVVTCATCATAPGRPKPHGRVVRLTFDRRTRRLVGRLRFCEVQGITPPLAACLRP